MGLMNYKNLNFIFLLFVLLFIFTSSCSNDDPSNALDNNNENDNNPNPELEIAGTIEIYEESLVDNSYLLVNDASSNRVYLMNKEKAEILHEWNLSARLGNDAELLPDGTLLAIVESENPNFSFGGFGGVVKIFNPDNTVAWEYEYASDTYLSHHDVQKLPNGNILFLAWQKKSAEESIQAGYSLNQETYPESIIEINPLTKTIVWEWHSWNHLIQDFDANKDNFGVISENPHLIDVNYNLLDNGDIMHANGIDYDEVNDLIYISVNFYHEIWVIDHSTTIEESNSHNGGNFNKGGDLIYRFGNPSAYRNFEGTRLFFNNHFPNILKSSELCSDLLIFNNGTNNFQSIIYELKVSNPPSLLSSFNNEPEISWSFQHPDLFSPRVSGAVRLSNGNTLIAEGDYGYWEVTNTGEVVWKFSGNGFYWRGYAYARDSPALIPYSDFLK